MLYGLINLKQSVFQLNTSCLREGYQLVPVTNRIKFLTFNWLEYLKTCRDDTHN